MSSFDELQRRVEAAERQFNAMSRQRRDYGQRLIDMIAMHERNLAESGEQVHVLRQEAAEARALAEERGRALDKARGENEQLRHMLHSLLTAIERNRSNDFEETMLELDRRISSMVAADSDSVARAGDSAEVSQAPEAWTPAGEESADDRSGHEAGDAEPIGSGDDSQADGGIATREAQAGAAPAAGAPHELAAEASGFDDLVAADWPDAQDLAETAPVGLAAAGDAPAPVPDVAPQDAAPAADRLPAEESAPDTGLPEPDQAEAGPEEAGLPVSGALGAELLEDEGVGAAASPLSLEEVLELAEASAEQQAGDALTGIDGDRLTPEDLATLTEMLEESVAAAEEQTADDDPAAGDGDTPLNQSSIANIAELIRAEQAAGMAAAGTGDGREAGDAGGEGGEDTRFELLDEEELQKGMTADRLFSADDYAEDGFGPVAAAEAEEVAEADEENAFDLSDLDLGGEIDGPPEAESEGDSLEGARDAGDLDGDPERDFDSAFEGGFEVIDDGPSVDAPERAGAGAGSDRAADAVTAEEEAELERWRAEVLGRVAQEAQEAAAARQGNAAGRAAGGGPGQGRQAPAGMTRGGPARGPDAEEDNALAELDAILAEEDLSYASGSGGEWSAAAAGEDSKEAPDLDPAFHVDLDDSPGPDLDIPPVHGAPRGGGLAPALRDKLDADTRAEILARVRQSHGNGRDSGN